MNALSHILSPLTIKSLELSNRVVMPPPWGPTWAMPMGQSALRIWPI